MKIFCMIIGFLMLCGITMKSGEKESLGAYIVFSIWVICATALILVPLLIQVGVIK